MISWLIKLIEERGGSYIQSKNLSLLRDQLSGCQSQLKLAESEIITLNATITRLTSENEKLGKEVRELIERNNNLLSKKPAKRVDHKDLFYR